MLTARPTQCVPGQAQDSSRAPVTVTVLTPTLNRVRCFKHLHMRRFWSPAPALVVPCSPMPVVSQMAAYQVCSHPASECLVDHLLHGICPNVMTLGRTKKGGFLDQGGMASKVLKVRCAHLPCGQACPQLGPLTDPDPWGSTSLGGVTIPLSVLRMSVCVSPLSPSWLPSSAFTGVGRKVLVSYWYHSYGCQFLCRRLTFGETAKALPTRGEGWPSVLRAYKRPMFLGAKR